MHQAGFYAEHNIELITGHDRRRHRPGRGRRVTPEGGAGPPSIACFLATGADAADAQRAGSRSDGVHYLRTCQSATSCERPIAGRPLAVVGAGWIGSKWPHRPARWGGSGPDRSAGASVPRTVLGAEVGAIFPDVHAESRGPAALGVGVESSEGTVPCEGSHLPRHHGGRDFVVVGVGVIPRRRAGRARRTGVDNGILVDERLRTSADNVFAAGDVANQAHPFYDRRIRVEHWANRAESGSGRRPGDARRRAPVRPAPLLLLRPVRRGDGVLRLCGRVGRRRLPGRPRGWRVRRLLAVRADGWWPG